MSNTALQRITQASLTNKSGGNLNQGDTVVISTGTASAFTTTTTSGFVNGIVGVIIEKNGIANNADGMVQFSGPCPKVNLSGSASLGDLFKTHTVAGQAVRHAAGIVAGDFGICLTSGSTPSAVLWGLPAGATGAGSGDFVGPASAVDGHLVVFDGTTGKLGKDGGAATSTGPYSLAQGRLTLTTALPVTTADVTGAGTLYWTPYKGDQIGLYDGASAWTVLAFAETSLSLTLTSGSTYDVFAYNNSGTLALESLIWSNPTTRATALVLQNGVLVKSGATTRRYLGTIYASGANTTEDSLLKRYVWNYYNRVRKPVVATDTTDSWTWNSASWRQARATAANKFEFVVGYAEDMVQAVVTVMSNGFGGVGIGLDSTSANSAQLMSENANGVGSYLAGVSAHYEGFPAVGYHYLAWLEYARSGTVTYGGDFGVADQQSGILGNLMC